jgi:hypothetical protein
MRDLGWSLMAGGKYWIETIVDLETADPNAFVATTS